MEALSVWHLFISYSRFHSHPVLIPPSLPPFPSYLAKVAKEVRLFQGIPSLHIRPAGQVHGQGYLHSLWGKTRHLFGCCLWWLWGGVGAEGGAERRGEGQGEAAREGSREGTEEASWLHCWRGARRPVLVKS